MSDAIGSAIQERLTEINGEIASIEDSIKTRLGPLKSEAKALNVSLAAINKARGVSSNGASASAGNGGATSVAVTNEQVIEVISIASGPQTSAQVAAALGVTPRNVGRKLFKLVSDGVLAGSKDVGYTLAPLPAVSEVPPAA